MCRVAAVVVLLAVLAGDPGVGRAQTPAAQRSAQSSAQPVFRAGTTLVEVSAVITRDGQPVTDLRADEVTVLDNGVPQPIVAFEYVDLGRVDGPAQRRDFVLLLDDLHIHPSRTSPAQDVALAFIRALGPHDRLAVITTARDDQQLDFTTERGTAEALARKVRGQMATGPAVSLIERDVLARSAMEVLRGVATGVRSDAAERRAVFLVSEGHVMPGDGTPRGGDVPIAWYEYLAVLREAALSNVSIYAVDPRGLMAPGIGNAEVSSRSRGTGVDQAGGVGGGPTMDARFGSLAMLSINTGGLLTSTRNDLDADIPRILQDSRQYYRLAYAQPESPPGKKQPLSRTIKVKVSRDDVDVRARQRYAPVPVSASKSSSQ